MTQVGGEEVGIETDNIHWVCVERGSVRVRWEERERGRVGGGREGEREGGRKVGREGGRNEREGKREEGRVEMK